MFNDERVFMMKSMNLWLSVVLSFFLVSCVSMDRMARVSPFQGDEGLAASDRVSLFPLYYQNHDENSVLWPLIDWDDEGFAVRPLWVKEGSEHAFLWPLSGFDTEKKDGWFLTSVWDNDSFGIFPLFYKDTDDFWLAELYAKHSDHDSQQYRFLSFLSNWKTWDNGDSRSWLFPLYYSSNIGEDSTFVSPLYINNTEKGKSSSYLLNTYWNDKSYGMFPFFHVAEDWAFYGPYLQKDDGYAVLPLFYKDDKNLWLAELYAKHKRLGSEEHRFLSFLGNYKTWDSGASRSWLMPFYYSHSYANSKFFISSLYVNSQTMSHDNSYLLNAYWGDQGYGLFPLFHVDDDWAFFGPYIQKDNGYAVLPLFYKDEKNFWLAELYARHEKEESVQHRALTVLANWESWDNGDSESWIFPLYYSSKQGEDESFYSPLYLSKKRGGKSQSYLLNTYWNDDGYGLFPFFHVGKDWSFYGPYLSKDEAFGVLPFFYKDEENTWFAELYARKQDEKSVQHRFLSFLAYSRKWHNGDSNSWLFPFYFHSSQGEEDSFYSLLFSRKYEGEELKNVNLLGLLYNSDINGSKKEASVLWPLFKRESDSKDDTAKTSVWPLFSYSDNTSREDFWDATSLLAIGTHEESDYISTWFWGRTITRRKPQSEDALAAQSSQTSLYSYRHNNYEEHTDGYYFLFGDYDEFKYADEIPRARRQHRQRLKYSYCNEFLFSSYKNKTFRRWKKGALSDVEMDLIDSYLEKKRVPTIKSLNKYPGVDLKNNQKATPAKMVKLLQKHGFSWVSSDPQSIKKALRALADKYSYLARTTERDAPFNIFESKYSEEDYEWELFWGALQSKKQAGRSQTSFLKYLYRREQEGEEVRRDIFPFIKCDSGEESRFAFLGFDKIGYLFDLKKDKKGWGGHFLFIPW